MMDYSTAKENYAALLIRARDMSTKEFVRELRYQLRAIRAYEKALVAKNDKNRANAVLAELGQNQGQI